MAQMENPMQSKKILLLLLLLSISAFAKEATIPVIGNVPDSVNITNPAEVVGGYKDGIITLTDKNTLSLNSQVNAESMGKLAGELQALNELNTNEPIYLILHSPGGSVYAGLDFIRYAKTSRRTVHTITLFSASMAFQIVEALGTRYMTNYSTLMSHRSSGGVEGNLPGSADTRYAHFLSHVKEQDEVVIKRTKGKFNAKTYAELIADEYWANAERAINDGFADEKVELVCDKSLNGTNNRVINLELFSVNVEFANCPIITTPVSVKAANNLDFIEKHNIDVNKEFNKALGF